MSAKTKGRQVWAGLDVGGTKMVACIYDRNFRCLARCKKKTRGENGDEAPLARMAAVIGEALADAGIPAGKLTGVGVGLAGVKKSGSFRPEQPARMAVNSSRASAR